MTGKTLRHRTTVAKKLTGAAAKKIAGLLILEHELGLEGAAKALNVSPITLRVWCKKGVPVKRIECVVYALRCTGHLFRFEDFY